MTNAVASWLAAGTPTERPDEVRDATIAIHAITRLLLDDLAEQGLGRLTCDDCGCLCLPSEVCPGCRSRLVAAAREDAQAFWAYWGKAAS